MRLPAVVDLDLEPGVRCSSARDEAVERRGRVLAREDREHVARLRERARGRRPPGDGVEVGRRPATAVPSTSPRYAPLRISTPSSVDVAGCDRDLAGRDASRAPRASPARSPRARSSTIERDHRGEPRLHRARRDDAHVLLDSSPPPARRSGSRSSCSEGRGRRPSAPPRSPRGCRPRTGSSTGRPRSRGWRPGSRTADGSRARDTRRRAPSRALRARWAHHQPRGDVPPAAPSARACSRSRRPPRRLAQFRMRAPARDRRCGRAP